MSKRKVRDGNEREKGGEGWGRGGERGEGWEGGRKRKGSMKREGDE